MSDKVMVRFPILIFLMINGLTITSAQSDIVGEILELQNSDLNYISDFTTVSKDRLVESGMEENMESMQVTDIRGYSVPDAVNCSDLPPLHNEIMRRKSILSLAWVENSYLPQLLSIYNRSVSKCPYMIKPGYYYRDNSFAFIIDDNVDEAKQIISEDAYISRHSNVVLLELLEEDNVIIHGYDVFTGTFKADLAGTKNPIVQTHHNFFPQYDMQGYHLIVDSLPDGYLTFQDYALNPASPNQAFVNQTGVEFFMLQSLAESLNFTYTLQNPPDLQFGFMDDTGHVNGMIGELINDTVDLLLGVATDDGGIQVSVVSKVFAFDAQILVTPTPRRVTDIAIFLHPLDWKVWTCLFLSWLTMSAFLNGTARKMVKWYKCDLSDWSSFGRALFFAYGTIIDHSAMRTSNMRSAGKDGLRFLMVIWMAATFVISAGYSAIVLTFMVLPSYEKPIENFADALQTGLPINAILYGSQLETYLNNSEDPTLHEVWNKLQIQPFDKPLTVERIQMVLERKWIVFEWMIELTTWIDLDYTIPDGTRLVHISTYSPWPRIPYTWGFYPLSPFYNRMNTKMQNLIDMGLIDAWKSQALAEIRKRKRAEGRVNSEYWRKAADENDLVVKPVALEDIYVLFPLLAILLAVTISVFCGEVGHNRLSRHRWFTKKVVPVVANDAKVKPL